MHVYSAQLLSKLGSWPWKEHSLVGKEASKGISTMQSDEDHTESWIKWKGNTLNRSHEREWREGRSIDYGVIEADMIVCSSINSSVT